jgi:Flp pilus assembly protein TadG
MRTKRTCGMKSRGQALVEMAIILPLLMLLVMGIFEFGRAMYIKNTLTNAARAGVRAAAVTPGLVSPAEDNGCTDAGIVFKTTCGSLYSGINKSDAKVTVKVFAPGADPSTDIPKTTDANSPPSPGDTVEVKVTLNDYHTKYRIIPFIPLPDTLTGTNAMRYE